MQSINAETPNENQDYQNHILLAILPYSTYRLQPLDVGLFRPLAQYYTQQLDQFMTET
jgi:hypothetical protein